MKEETILYSFRASKKIIDLLKHEAEISGRSVSDVIRQYIMEGLKDKDTLYEKGMVIKPSSTDGLLIMVNKPMTKAEIDKIVAEMVG